MVNKKMIKTIRYSLEELMFMSFRDLVHPEDLIRMESNHLEKEKEKFCSFRLMDKDKTIKQAVSGYISSSDLATWGGKLSKDDSHVHIVLIS